MRNYNWVTLGCGVIANELAAAMADRGLRLYGVANRTKEKARAFAQAYGAEKVYERIEDAFADEKADVIYISTPHNTHISYLRQALAAGKHVLCEKSITLNSEELEEACALAGEKQVVLAEAMTIYHMPLYRELQRRMEKGEWGRLRFVQANFGSYKEYNMNNRFFNPNLAGGALLDIGVYALSLTRWFMADKPEQVASQVQFAPTGVDEQAGILLMNQRQEMAAISLSLHAKQPKRATIAFDRAYVEIFDYPRAVEATVTWTEDGRRERIAAGTSGAALRYETEDMERAIAAAEAGRPDQAAMHLDYTRDVMDLMTGLRESWGFRYPEEER